MANILFVCLGNICRSPAAEGIMRHMVAKDSDSNDFKIESCGMGDWHRGQLPDERICNAAKLRGYTLASRAKSFQRKFLDEFDFILAADHEVLNDLYRYALSPSQKAKIHLITHYSSTYKDEEIPDPYYGGEAAFELVLDMLEDSCEGLLAYIKSSKIQKS